jgi:putative Ca2+/H+ antiporter (TMEM165/GDT1 family)
MDWQLFFVTFGTVFLSELGDKSQLATLSISSNSKALRYVFIGSASALLLSSLIGVLLGDRMAEIIPTKFLKAIAAAIFAFMAIKVLD